MSDSIRRLERAASRGAKNEHSIGSAKADVQRQSQPSAVRRPREGVPSSEANAVSTTLCGLGLEIAACIQWR